MVLLQNYRPLGFQREKGIWICFQSSVTSASYPLDEQMLCFKWFEIIHVSVKHPLRQVLLTDAVRRHLQIIMNIIDDACIHKANVLTSWILLVLFLALLVKQFHVVYMPNEFKTESKKLSVLQPRIPNHKHKIEDFFLSSRSSFKIVCFWQMG